jgi:hypothetical protein
MAGNRNRPRPRGDGTPTGGADMRSITLVLPLGRYGHLDPRPPRTSSALGFSRPPFLCTGGCQAAPSAHGELPASGHTLPRPSPSILAEQSTAGHPHGRASGRLSRDLQGLPRQGGPGPGSVSFWKFLRANLLSRRGGRLPCAPFGRRSKASYHISVAAASAVVHCWPGRWRC